MNVARKRRTARTPSTFTGEVLGLAGSVLDGLHDAGVLAENGAVLRQVSSIIASARSGEAAPRETITPLRTITGAELGRTLAGPGGTSPRTGFAFPGAPPMSSDPPRDALVFDVARSCTYVQHLRDVAQLLDVGDLVAAELAAPGERSCTWSSWSRPGGAPVRSAAPI